MRSFLFIILLTLVVQCSKEKLLPSDYISWVDDEENGLTKSRKFNDIVFEIKYRPIDYLISKEFKTNKIKYTQYLSRYGKLEDMQYFSLRIKNSNKNESDVLLKNIQNDDDYFQRVNYYSFHFNNSISLIVEKDTLIPGIYNFVRTHGVAPYVDFVFAFPKKSSAFEGPMQVIIDDQIFNNGRIKFLFSKSQLDKTPELITY